MSFQASDRFLRVLKGLPVDRTPVWLMRQAGRYLPEYRAVRQKAGTFLDLCRNPQWATEVTLQPLQRFPLDAAILFQDILTLPHAMGASLHFAEGEGPVFENPIQTMAHVDSLVDIQTERDLGFLIEQIDLICNELDGKVPLIGFCGSPWTVATYLVEGKVGKQFAVIRKMMVQAPDVLHALLKRLAENSIVYLKAQIKHGASCVMLFDTWGGILPHEFFKSFSLHYMNQIISALKADPTTLHAPVIVFTKQGAPWYEDLAALEIQALGVDWTSSLSHVRKQTQDKVALQGNMDPFMLYGSQRQISDEVQRILKDFGFGGRHIFNLGHGMLPDHKPEKVQMMLDALHEYSPQYHRFV